MSPAKKSRTVALYLRVSTDKQTVANQRRELEAVAERNGWSIVQEFADRGISGAKGRDGRPGLDALLKGVARKEFDVVAAWSVDRLGRSLQDLVALLSDLHAKGVDLYLHQQGIDTTTASGRMLFQMLGVFAEFERSMIRERVQAGLARARAQGKRLGRPPLAPEREQAVKKAHKRGGSIREIAAETGVSVGTVQRIVASAV